MTARALAFAAALVLEAVALASVAAAHPKGHGTDWTPPPLASAPAEPTACLAVGAPLFVEWKGSYWKARVLARVDERLVVHYEGWGKEWDELVSAERVAQARPGARAVAGAPVMIEWKGSYWRGTVIRAAGDRGALVHYEGWGNEWDEVASSDRLMTPSPVCGPRVAG